MEPVNAGRQVEIACAEDGDLARATVESQFGGEISRDWKPEGLTIRLVIDRMRL